MTARHLPGKHNQESHGDGTGVAESTIAHAAGKALGKMTEDAFFSAHGENWKDQYGSADTVQAILWETGTASLYRDIGKGRVHVFGDVDGRAARRLADGVKWAVGHPDIGPPGDTAGRREVDLGGPTAQIGASYDGDGDLVIKVTMPPVGGEQKSTAITMVDLDQVDELVDDLNGLADAMDGGDNRARVASRILSRSETVKEVDMAVSAAMRPQTEQSDLLERSVPFEMDASRDGLTLEGYAAVFDSPTRIDSWEGDFDEVILRGAFKESLRQRMPVLMFEHGKHPLIGTMPLGVITRAAEDDKGLHIQARLSDNWLIQPVRDAVRDKAVNGMSFRFSVPEGGEKWERAAERDLRTLRRLVVPELGPVVFPAYEPTTATVRSLVERLPNVTGRPDTRSAAGGASDAEPGTGKAAKSPDELRTLERVHKALGVL